MDDDDSTYLIHLKNIQKKVLNKKFKEENAICDMLFHWMSQCMVKFRTKNSRSFQLAITIVNQCPLDLEKHKYQALAVIAISLAYKHGEYMPPSYGDWSWMTDGAYTIRELIEFEAEVLQSLSYSLEIGLLSDFIELERIQDCDTSMLLRFLGDIICVNSDISSRFTQHDIANVLIHIARSATKTKCESPTFDIDSECYQIVMDRLLNPNMEKTVEHIKEIYSDGKHFCISKRLKYNPIVLED